MPKIIVIGSIIKVIVENVVTCFWGTQCRCWLTTEVNKVYILYGQTISSRCYVSGCCLYPNGATRLNAGSVYTVYSPNYEVEELRTEDEISSIECS